MTYLFWDLISYEKSEGSFQPFKECRSETGTKEVHKYLGHIFSKDGIGADPQKLETVAHWPTPSNKKQLRSFLGLCTYYRQFVKHFLDICKCLYKLTEKSVLFE